MMQAMETQLEVTKIIVEPGDMTRYEFHVHQDYDEFFISPCKRSFLYPQHINKWDIKNTVETCIGLLDLDGPITSVVNYFKAFDKVSMELRVKNKEYIDPFMEMAKGQYDGVNPYTIMAVYFSIYDVFKMNLI